jgi:signal transduction histidine kinase
LKTPLNIILSSLQLLEFNKKTNEFASMETHFEKFMDTVKHNCGKMLKLIDNLMNAEEACYGFRSLSKGLYDIVSIVENTTLSMVEYFKARQLDLIFDTEIEEKIIYCDIDKIESIMLNLLANAAKFTEPGGKILVNIRNKSNRIIISVADTGIGIPEDALEDIFMRFKKVASSKCDAPSGNGIGLYLAKSLVELHGGNLYVKSKLGQGSEFIFEIPC